MATPNINKLLRASPVNCKYGAPMGACSYFDNPDEPLYVQRIRFVDGDYAPDSTYIGEVASLSTVPSATAIASISGQPAELKHLKRCLKTGLKPSSTRISSGADRDT